MASALSEFRRWLKERRGFRVALFEKDPQLTVSPEETLVQLPEEIADDLLARANALSNPAAEVDAVLNGLNDAIAAWRENPQLADNSLVVLAHPVLSVSRILTDSLYERRAHQSSSLPINILDWIDRPANLSCLKRAIKEKLGREDDTPSSAKSGRADQGQPNEGQSASAEESLESASSNTEGLAIIPNLCWCFLRSADGLDGIDYLQETLLSDRTQFWIVGSGQVGWEYLKSTLKIHAYCGKVISLPALSAQQLQDWLEPLITQFNIRFSEPAIHEKLRNPAQLLKELSLSRPIDAVTEVTHEMTATVQASINSLKNDLSSEDKSTAEESGPKYSYFSRLADISDGVSIVALQLFIISLRYREATEEEKKTAALSPAPVDREAPQTSPPSAHKQLIAITPRLPPLPDLSQSDLYLLYSLMLHGDLSILALAKSLGDAPQVVNNQVQVLRNSGVIEQKNGVIKANPMHYPRLRRELSRNNFIIEVP